MAENKEQKKLLLVEDEPIIAITEMEVLKNNGFEVDTVASGEMALVQVEKKIYDLILMDIDLGKGKMMGTDTAEKVLQKQELPVVFLTSHREKEVVDRVKGITRYGYVLKDSGEFVLIETINMAFQLFHAHKELKEKEIQREKSLSILKSTFRAVDSLLIVINRDFQIQFCNWKDHEWVSEKNRDSRLTCYSAMKNLSQPCPNCPSVQTFHDGRTRWYEDQNPIDGSFKEIGVIPIFGKSNEVEYVLENVRDVTDRKKAEEKIKLGQEKFEKIFNNTNDAVYIHDLEGHILEANETACNQTGYRQEELLSMNLWALNIPASVSKINERMSTVDQKEKMVFDAVHQRKDGSVFSVEVNSRKIKHKGRTCIISVVRDISEYKKLESSFLEREERFGIINELSSDYAYCHKLSEDGTLEPVWHIGSFDQITGYTPEELYRLGGWSKLIHPDDIPGAARYIENLFSGKEDSYTARIVTKDGSIRWIKDKGKPWFDPQTGQVIGTFGSARDITEQKEVELDLVKNEALFRNLMENSIDAVYLLTEEGEILKTNQVASQMTGYSGEELLKMTVSDIDPNYPANKFTQFWVDQPEKATILFETTHKHKSGTLFPVEVNGIFFHLDGKKYHFGVVRDLSERKRIEKELQNSIHKKELLMREFQHRVKNNFLMVKSLVALKNSTLGNQIDLTDLINQINAIVMVNSRLIQAENFTKI
ncbi:MAG: PAS domain S-box protein, partial [Spirochaetes bacterium]|nr:PAS domain S-box protein [Spirochaetota bacterium]